MNTTANSLPDIAIAAPTPPRAGRWSKDLLRSLRRILAVARCELLLQIRSITFWLLLALCTILGGLAGSFITQNAQTVMPFISYAFENGLVEFLLPFFFMNMFARDHRRKTQTLLWTRPLASTEYALGKCIATILLGLCISLFPLGASYVLNVSVKHTLIAGPLFTILPVLVVSTILITLLSLLCIALIPRPLLGAIAAVGIVLYVNLFSPKTLFEIVNLQADTAFYSPSIGFGPDSDLVRLQTFFMALLALLFLGLVPLVYMRRESRGIAAPKQWLPLLIPIFLALVLFVPTISTFQNVVATFDDLGPEPAAPISATISNYQLQVTADPNASHLEGTASFTLTPQNGGTKTLYLALNPKLQIQQLRTDNNVSLPLQTSDEHLGWTQVETSSTPFSQGQPLHLTITYSGSLAISRDNYGQYSPGFLGGGNSSTSYPFSLSYLGQGFASLLGTGANWYPLPWTQQALAAGFRPAIDTVQLRFPSSIRLFSSIATAQRTTDGQWWQVITHPHRPLPDVVATTLTNPKQIPLENMTLFYQGTPLAQDLLPFYKDLARQLTEQEILFSPTHLPSHWTMIVTPLIHIPLIGPGVVLVPEQASFFYNYGPLDSPAISLRTAGLVIAEAWWSNSAPLTLSYSQDNYSGPSHDMSVIHLRPHGYATFNEGLPTDIAPMLSGYQAGIATAHLVGQDLLQQEIATCQDFRVNGNTPTYNELDHPLSIFCQDQTLMLYLLGQQFGFERINQFVVQTAQEQPLPSLKEFLQQLSNFLHYDVIKEYTSYICSYASSDAETLSCLKNNNRQ